MFHLLFFPEFQPLSIILSRSSLSKSLRGFNLILSMSQLFWVILLLPEFFMKVLHDWFIKDLMPSPIFHRDSLLRSSSFLLLAIRSAILSTLSFEVVLCHSWQFPFAYHDSTVVKNEIVKPINFFEHELLSTNQSLHWSYLGLYFT